MNRHSKTFMVVYDFAMSDLESRKINKIVKKLVAKIKRF